MPDPKPPPPGESGIYRDSDGTEHVNVSALMDAIAAVTQGRDRAHPELSILAFEVLRAIITGERADHLRELYTRAVDTTAWAHAKALHWLEFFAQQPLAPAEAGPQLGMMLRILDASFGGLFADNFVWAIARMRERGSSAGPEVLAHLSAKCGAFGVDQDGLEATTERARSKFAKSRTRFR